MTTAHSQGEYALGQIATAAVLGLIGTYLTGLGILWLDVNVLGRELVSQLPASTYRVTIELYGPIIDGLEPAYVCDYF